MSNFELRAPNYSMFGHLSYKNFPLTCMFLLQTLKQRIDEEGRVNNEIESFLRQHYKVRLYFIENKKQSYLI